MGMTRAKERLVLTRAKVRSRRGTARAAVPSRYLAEIAEPLTERGGAEPSVSREEEDAMARNFFSGLAAMLEGEKKQEGGDRPERGADGMGKGKR